MKYRVEIDISFGNEEDAISLMNYIETIKSKTYEPNDIESIKCRRTAQAHKCHHDEVNPSPCENYKFIDFKSNDNKFKIGDLT